MEEKEHDRYQEYNVRHDYEEFRPWGMEVRQFCLFMHLAQFAGFIVPFAGMVLPIVMWATNKDQSEEVDMHGKEILNWIITVFIFSAIAFILTFLFIGIFLFIAIFIVGIIFPIIGGVQAGNGQFWRYPMNIRFIS